MGFLVHRLYVIVLLCASFIFLGAACSFQADMITKQVPKAIDTDNFTFVYDEGESDVCSQIKDILYKECPSVRSHLQFSGPTSFTVQIYSNQQSYDSSLLDPSVAGSPACSGSGKISLVSPRYPICVTGVSYEQRLTMAVHEYTHLLVNEINAEAPIWLAEGIACYEGAGGRYIEPGSKVAASLKVISLSSLENSYYDTPGADVYSFLAVHFIINTCGYDALNRLLRNPGDFEHILNLSKTDFDSRWSEYICAYGKG